MNRPASGRELATALAALGTRQRRPRWAVQAAAAAAVAVVLAALTILRRDSPRALPQPREGDRTPAAASGAAARALEAGPYLAEAHQARAQVLSSLHQNFDFRRALPEARRALELSPKLDISNYWMGVGYGLHLGLLDEAVGAIERTMEISPKWGAPVATLGWIRLQQGRYDDALAATRRAAELAPRFSVGYVTTADAHLRKGEDGEAGKAVARALEIEPRNTWALSLKAVLAERRGASAEADRLLEESWRMEESKRIWEADRREFTRSAPARSTAGG